MTLPADLSARLNLPLIAAPMFLVSGPDVVIAACLEGVIGAFPTVNCRTLEDLDGWLGQISGALERARGESPNARIAPFCPNLIVHPSNPRRDDDMRLVIQHGAELVIASVGNPKPVMQPLQDAGVRVFVDVASLRHADRALEAGADGLVLLTAGAGGQTGWANPFAFARAVRKMFDGPIIMAGGISDGEALFAAQALGCDLAYMGTRFIATAESLAPDGYKDMLVTSRLDDIKLTKAFTGLETNMLRASIQAAGLDPDNLPDRGTIDVSQDINPEARDKKRYRDIWSAGHSVSGVGRVLSVKELVAETAAEYRSARGRVAAMPG